MTILKAILGSAENAKNHRTQSLAERYVLTRAVS